jgi:hypothetical protein
MKVNENNFYVFSWAYVIGSFWDIKKSISFFIVRRLCGHRALNYTANKNFSPHSQSASARDKTSKIYNYVLGSFRN